MEITIPITGVDKEVVSLRMPTNEESEGWVGFTCNCFAMRQECTHGLQNGGKKGGTHKLLRKIKFRREESRNLEKSKGVRMSQGRWP